MKDLKIAIIIISVIIVIIMLVLGLILMNINKKDPIEIENDYQGEEEFEYEATNNLELVKDKNTYYAVKGIVEKYFTYYSYINNKEIAQEQNANIEIINQMLDENYIEKYDITKEKIREYKVQYDDSKQLNIEEMYKIEKNSRINIYWINANINHDTDLKIIVKTDSYNNTFSIFPEEYININQYNEQNIESNLDINDSEIPQKQYNTFKYTNITNEQNAKEYLKDYINKVTYKMELAYECLENEYKEKRFPTIQEYKKYINNANIKNIELQNCYVEKYNDYTQYTCKDQYGNVYIFKYSAIMEYTIQLDDYTLENQSFNSKYEEASNRDKGILNIDKFFKMINMQDYTAAYEVLDENFKQNYFKTEQDFEKYIKNKMFRYNKVEYKEYSNKITDIHTYKVVLTDATEENQNQVEFNIVMKLLEETDFVMSFEVN